MTSPDDLKHPDDFFTEDGALSHLDEALRSVDKAIKNSKNQSKRENKDD